jgi:hypothetical protein
MKLKKGSGLTGSRFKGSGLRASEKLLCFAIYLFNKDMPLQAILQTLPRPRGRTDRRIAVVV